MQRKRGLVAVALASALGMIATGAFANNQVEGDVEEMDAEQGVFKVQGIEFQTDDSTDYEGDLSGLEDLEDGQQVEVEFEYREGEHVATEVEVED